MVSTQPPTSKSSSPFNNPLVTVSKAPITIDIIVTFMFHRFFNSLASSRYFILLFIFFQFYSVVSRDSKVDNFAYSLFLLIIIRSGVLSEIRRSVCTSKSHRSICVSFSRTGDGLCIYHLFAWSNNYYYYYYYSLRIFHINFSWLFFPGVWVTASLLKSPGLFSVFWPFPIMF